MKLVLLMAAVMILIQACHTGPGPSGGKTGTIVGEWEAISIGGVPVERARVPWIRVEEGGRLSGWAGVNTISSQLDGPSLERSEFKASAIIATRMAGPPEDMNLEADVVAAVQNARTFSVKGEMLELRDGAGAVSAVFKRKAQSAASIVGSWQLSRMNGKDLTTDPRPRLTVDERGGVSGWGGVNRFTAQVDPEGIDKGEFALSTLISTEMAGSPEARAIEQQVFGALQSAARFKVVGDRLDIMDAKGATTLSYNRTR